MPVTLQYFALTPLLRQTINRLSCLAVSFYQWQNAASISNIKRIMAKASAWRESDISA